MRAVEHLDARREPGALERAEHAVVVGEEQHPADVEQHRFRLRHGRKATQWPDNRLVPWIVMEFRRINALPPYAFAQIDALKMQLRRAGEDVIDLAFGNPDMPSPRVAVEKLAEAVRNPRNHRYSTSKRHPEAARRRRRRCTSARSASTLDFETEVCSRSVRRKASRT